MVTTREIAYPVDGVTMAGHLALPDGTGRRPAVLIAHEGPGLTEHQRMRADRLAGLGYVAFALDYHGGGRFIEDREEMFARVNELLADPDRLRTLGGAGLDVLLAEPRTDPARLAAIGYCLGGTMALELARGGTDLKAVVGFHPSLTTTRPEDAARITGRVLVCVGSEDPFIPAEQRRMFEEEMRAAGVDWRMNIFGGALHSFTHPDLDPDPSLRPGIGYHEPSAECSWRAMLDLFGETWEGTSEKSSG
ncbi:dienelactone hydrolase family protein [Streptomyces sp. NPDC005355]|uniref:dienelactone hydrolase family protein n=1 Tax=Streptomyces sp. NPDC005355 TaxID=3157038 RepID=UPI0033B4F06F